MANKKTEKRSQKKAEKKRKAGQEPAAPKLPSPVAAQPRAPDPRLPAPGTVLQKRDRHGVVRCECTVEEGGIRYAGNEYRSLSAAAMAAAKDLGLTNRTANGFVFWGLSKPPRPAGDPVAALAKAWERYHERATQLVEKGVTDQNRDAVRAAVERHVGMLGEVAGELN